MGQGLRAVFVNHTHPDEKHVSALRMMSFARALAAAGHKVVLLCETLAPDDAAVDIADLGADLASHDYATPYVLGCRPQPSPLLAGARVGKLPFGLRQAVLGTGYLLNSGVFADWRDGARVHIPVLAEHFRPDIVWATFGNTDAWNIARMTATTAGCPWVADIKDPWSRFLPHGLARLIAGRYRDAAHMTVFSDSHGDEARRFFGQHQTTIYSGFEPVPGFSATTEPLRVLLTGSVYDDDDDLELLLDGLAMWLRDAPVSDVVFTYAGNDATRVERKVHRLDGLCKIDLRPFMPNAELCDLQRRALVNTYIHNPRCLFQHKVLELLAAGRPVVCVPGEGDEAKRIAGQVGAHLLAGETPADIAHAIGLAAAGNLAPPEKDKLNAYCWPRQADKLAALFQALVGGGR